MIDTLTPEEQALIEQHRARKEQARAELADFEPSHVAMAVMSHAVDGGIAVPQTTNADSSARNTHLCALAWRIFGTLVHRGHITVDFTRPDWAQEVRFAINNITAVLIAG